MNAFKSAVHITDVLPAKAFQYHYHNVLGFENGSGIRVDYRRVYLFKFLLAEILRHLNLYPASSTNGTERGVKYCSGIGRPVNILVGVAHSYGSYAGGYASANAYHTHKYA